MFKLGGRKFSRKRLRRRSWITYGKKPRLNARRGKSNGRHGIYSSRASNGRGYLSKAAAIFAVILILYGLYYLFYSEKFAIKEINVEGQQNISEYAIKNIIEEQFNKSRFLIFKQNNLLLFKKSLAGDNIKKSYVLDKLKINKEFPHSLRVIIDERVSTVIWLSKEGEEEEYYYLDLDGIVLGEIPLTEIEKLLTNKKTAPLGEESVEVMGLLKETDKKEQSQATKEKNNEKLKSIPPYIVDLSGEKVNIKERVLDKKTINFAITLATKFREIFPDKKIKYFATPKKRSSRLHLITEEGWEAFFESSRDLDEQLTNLKLVIKQKIKNLSRVQYIDLRFGERIYYK